MGENGGSSLFSVLVCCCMIEGVCGRDLGAVPPSFLSTDDSVVEWVEGFNSCIELGELVRGQRSSIQ